jgi:hypothetical protein
VALLPRVVRPGGRRRGCCVVVVLLDASITVLVSVLPCIVDIRSGAVFGCWVCYTLCVVVSFLPSLLLVNTIRARHVS